MPSPTRIVWAAAGGPAELPCNLTAPLPKDAARLVLWYKTGVHKPIYRNALIIQRVELRDEGTYRCRVDFRTNPTLTFTSNLSVVVPPHNLVVYTDEGAEVRSSVGPFLEGDTITLHCRAIGGSPPPRVTWWEGAVLLDMTSEEETSEHVTNTLLVTSLSRRDLHRPLTCQAANTNLTEPLETTVTINMNFPPLLVRILGDQGPLSAGRPYDLLCQAVGARPPAVITWSLDDSSLTTHTDQSSQEGNVTTSELRWTPNVPVTKLQPGRSLNLSNIEEGDDVYFECSIQSNPWVYKIGWLHESKELQHNVTAGIIISNQSLVLQRVARRASGNYYCVASNIEGDGHSNPILLRVKCEYDILL
ncbi:Cell adhesion molecule 1-like [Homarus americanus]|uniref:Cell adhesion molecule 1-like n=1 Tax=Homarus americanus TaxID=6706 RepID=A0A8J5JND6_HOMAM|nr:Cell adhesion molecule 1-like [Homarus americanus]